MIHKSWSPDRPWLFTDHLKQLFVKTKNQNLPFVRAFVFRKTTKFLFTLYKIQFSCISLQKVLNCTLFSWICTTFWPKYLRALAPNSHWRNLECSPYLLEVQKTHKKITSKKIIQRLCCDVHVMMTIESVETLLSLVYSRPV